MARQLKSNADWFAHSSTLHNELPFRQVRKKLGTEGYGALMMLLELIAHSDGLSLESEAWAIADDIGIDEARLSELLEASIAAGLIEHNDGIITSPFINRCTAQLSYDRERMRLYREGKRKQSNNYDESSEPFRTVPNGSNTVQDSTVQYSTVEDSTKKERVKKKEPPQRFTPPTITEVEDYANSIGHYIDGERFCDFYGSKGWMVGKNKMKDWKAAVRNWYKREEQNNSNKNGQRTYQDSDAERIARTGELVGRMLDRMQ